MFLKCRMYIQISVYSKGHVNFCLTCPDFRFEFNSKGHIKLYPCRKLNSAYAAKVEPLEALRSSNYLAREWAETMTSTYLLNLFLIRLGNGLVNIIGWTYINSVMLNFVVFI